MSEHTPLTEAERRVTGEQMRDWSLQGCEHTLRMDEGRACAPCMAKRVNDWLAARTSTATADTVPWGACTGASNCPERWHVHGCFADRGRCDDPTDHAATVDTGLRERVEEVARDLHAQGLG